MVTLKNSNAIFKLTRACKCKLWTNKLIELSGIKPKSVVEIIYDKLKQQMTTALPVLERCGQGQNEQQQQPANHSSNNAETVRCLTPFSPPSLNVCFFRRLPYIDGPSSSSYKPLQNVRFWKVGNEHVLFFPEMVLTYWQELKRKNLSICFSSK